MEALEVHGGGQAGHAAGPRKRKLPRLGCLIKGGLGCGALLFGSGVALMLLAPSILSSSTTMAEDLLERKFRGQFAVEEMQLSWFSDQSVRNFEVRDPDGERVGVFNMQLPPLWTLMAEGSELGSIELQFDASLSVDATGVSNLERAFEPTGTDEWADVEPRSQSWESRRRGLRERYGDLEVQVTLKPSRLAFEEKVGGTSRRIEIEGLEGRLRVDRGQRVELTLGGDWGPVVPAAPEPGPSSGSPPDAARDPARDTARGGLSIDATLENAFSGSDSANPMAFDAAFEVRELPTALFDVASEGAPLREKLGDTLSGRAELRGTLQAGSFGVSAGGELASVALEGTFDRGMLMATGGDLNFRLPRELAERGAAISARSVESSPPVSLAIEELTLSLGPLLDEMIDPERTRTAEPWRELLRGASIRIVGEAGDWTIGEDPEARRLAVSIFGAPVGDDCGLSLELAREPLEISVHASRAVALLEALEGAEVSAASLQVGVSGLPTAGVASPELAPVLGDVIAADLQVELGRPESADLQAEGFLELRSADAPTRIEFEASVPDPAAVGAFGLPPLTATVDCPAATAEVLLALAGLPEECGYLAGEGLHFAWGEGARGDFRVEARSESFGLEVGGRFSARGFQAEGPARVQVVADARLMDCVLGELAGGARLLPAEEGGLVQLSLEDLQFPSPGPQPFDFPRFLAGVEGLLEGSIPDLVFSQSGEDATIRQIVLEGELSPGEAAALRLEAQLEGEPENGFLEIALAVTPRPGEVPAFATSIEGTWEGVPTSVADAALAQEGLLLDALGPRVAGSVSGEVPGDEPVHLVLDSDLAHLDLDASVKEGVLSSRGENGIDASVGLTPLVSKRLVGPFLPLLVDLDKPAGAEPVGISMRDFDLPLDGNLSSLNGRLDLNLGEISYRLFPGLDPILALGGLEQELRLEKVPPIGIRIEQGIAHYEGFPVTIEGKSYLFRGSYDLTKSSFDLATSIPLQALGKNVSRVLDQARDVLDPELEVPIRLSGTWRRPKISIEDSFLSKLTENALQGALQRLLKKDD